MNAHPPIRKLRTIDRGHMDLLLLADETREAIGKYIHDAEVYVLDEPDRPCPIAIVALQKLNAEEIEIKNIAVAEHMQGKGIGSYLVSQIKKIALQQGYKIIIVGTPDTSYRQISFYERNGFSRYDIKRNYFIDNYTEAIIEDGILLRDMVMLRCAI
jgi:ribosomal protein S18 acetylase RimI-like enzyme